MLTLVLFLLVIAHNLHDTVGAATKRSSSDDRIPELLSAYGNDNVPEECKDQTYCTIKPPNYPEEHFNKLLDGLKTLPPPSLVIKPTPDNRFADPGEKDDCDAIQLFDRIYQVRTKRENEWMTVVQAPEVEYEQRVRLEICNELGAPCFKMFPPIPDNKVFCKQKYSRWEMLVAKGTETVKVGVDLPVCCSCVYQSNPLR